MSSLYTIRIYTTLSSSVSSYASDISANVNTGSDSDLPGLDGDDERSPYADHSLTYFVLCLLGAFDGDSVPSMANDELESSPSDHLGDSTHAGRDERSEPQ